MDRNPPWGQIKLKYLTGYIDEQGHQVLPTLEQLAEEYDLHISTVLRHSADEGWAKQRAKMQERIMLDAFRQYESEMAETIGRIDRHAIKLADTLLQIIEEALEQTDDKKERFALALKCSRVLSDILDTSHNAYGVDILMNGRHRWEYAKAETEIDAIETRISEGLGIKQ